MTGIWSTALLGLALGVRHATDADHVIAVAAIAGHERRVPGAVTIGLLWGLGHGLVVVLAGLALVWLDMTIPPSVGLAAELVVAAMLIGLGIWSIADLRRPAHSHAAQTDEGEKSRVYRALRPVAMGAMHGLAGSAALALLLVPLTDNGASATAYLMAFAVGTLLGMMVVTAAIAAPVAYGSGRWGDLQRRLQLVAGVVSLLFGVFFAWHVASGA